MNQALLILTVVGTAASGALAGAYLNADGTVVPTMGKVAFAGAMLSLNVFGAIFIGTKKD